MSKSFAKGTAIVLGQVVSVQILKRKPKTFWSKEMILVSYNIIHRGEKGEELYKTREAGWVLPEDLIEEKKQK